MTALSEKDHKPEVTRTEGTSEIRTITVEVQSMQRAVLFHREPFQSMGVAGFLAVSWNNPEQAHIDFYEAIGNWKPKHETTIDAWKREDDKVPHLDTMNQLFAHRWSTYANFCGLEDTFVLATKDLHGVALLKIKPAQTSPQK